MLFNHLNMPQRWEFTPRYTVTFTGTHTSKSSTWWWRCAGTAEWSPHWCPGRSRGPQDRMPEVEASYSDGLKTRKQDGTYSFIFCLVLTSHTYLSLSHSAISHCAICWFNHILCEVSIKTVSIKTDHLCPIASRFHLHTLTGSRSQAVWFQLPLPPLQFLGLLLKLFLFLQELRRGRVYRSLSETHIK